MSHYKHVNKKFNDVHYLQAIGPNNFFNNPVPNVPPILPAVADIILSSMLVLPSIVSPAACPVKLPRMLYEACLITPAVCPAKPPTAPLIPAPIIPKVKGRLQL